MRLHSDFHDYYDNAVGYGIDNNVHYNRFTKEVEIHIKSQFDFPFHKRPYLLGFCGKIYPLIEIKKYDRKYDEEYDLEGFKLLETFYAYSYEEYKLKQSEWSEYANTSEYSDYSRELKLKQFFIDWDYQSDDVFLEYKVPIWIVKLERGMNNGWLNPRLKDYGFNRIKDSFTAFQDISMYLSNILVEQKEIAKIEDKFRIEQHGFDLKKSFRKEKKLQ